VPTGPLPAVGALGADCHAPSAPHWCHCESPLDCTHVRAGTVRPSVAELHHGHEAVQLVGLVVVPAVKVPSPWHCRQMASEPRPLGWPLCRGPLRRLRGLRQVLQNGAYPTGCLRVRQHPPGASTVGTGEDIQRESTA
jgi:hypothetical protein